VTGPHEGIYIKFDTLNQVRAGAELVSKLILGKPSNPHEKVGFDHLFGFEICLGLVTLVSQGVNGY
jgi:hypothetical protein